MVWHGITYYWPSWLLWLWKITLCRIGWHLFDEVQSSALGHYLSCDACDFAIGIDDKWRE